MKDRNATHGEKKAKAIDWGEVHQRLEAAQAAAEQGWMPGPGERSKILKARARALAREPDATAVTEERIDVVEFLLAHERYGIESSSVREVYPLKEFTPVPCTPSFVLGMANVRGQILSVIDLKKFFDLPHKGLADLNKVIVARRGEMTLGILADVILGVRSLPIGDIQPPPPTLTGICAEYLKGVTGERLVVLDVEKVLSDERIVVHQQVET